MKLRTPFALLTLTLILALFSTGSGSAGHLLGSDIQFTCIGNDKYHVKLVVRRNCNGVSMSSSESLNWTGIGGSCSGVTTLTRTSISDVTPVCGSQCTACESGCSFAFGMEEHVYEDTIDLSNFTCDEFEFYYYQCCRDANTITNITSSDHYRIEAYLNTGVHGCPTTPEYPRNNSPLYICKDMDFEYNPNILAPPGDSLVFSMVSPLEGSGMTGNNVSFYPNYNVYEPFEYMGKSFMSYPTQYSMPYGFHLDSTSGELKFRPTSTMNGVMSIGVNQYRGDTLVSKTQRDLHVDVIDCPPNSAPVMSSPTQMHSICEDSTLSFAITLKDPDSIPSNQDSVFMTWNDPTELQGAVFEEDSGLVSVQSTFTWSPQIGDARAVPYFFTVFGQDNACPLPGEVAKNFGVTVNPIPDANIQADYKNCGKVAFTADLTNIYSGTIKWSGDGGLDETGDSVTHIYDQPGAYPFSVTITRNGCQNVFHDTVVIPDPISVNVDAGGDVNVCKNAPFTVTPVTFGESGSVDFHWSTGDSNEPSMTFAFSKDTTIIVSAVDNAGCTDSDTVNVFVNYKPSPEIKGDLHICGSKPTEIGSGYPDSYHHEWTDLTQNTVISNDTSIAVNNSGYYAVAVSTNNQLCTGYDTVNIIDHPEPEASFSVTNQCEGEMTAFMSTSSVSSGSITEYEWDFGDGNTSTFLGPQHLYSSSGIYTVNLKVTSDALCTDEISKNIEIYNTPIPDFSTDPVCADDTFRFENLTSYSGGSENLSYEWDFGIENKTSSEFEPVFFYEDTGTYTVELEAVSSQGCKKAVSKPLEVNKSPVAEFETADTCAGSSLFINNKSTGNNIVSHWNFGDGSEVTEHEPQHVYESPGTYQLSLNVSNDNLCTDEYQTEVKIFELPDAGFTYNKSGKTVEFLPHETSLVSYKWDFDDGNSSNNVNPVHVYQEEGTYLVSFQVEGANGCVNDTSKLINVSGVSLKKTDKYHALNPEIYPNPFMDQAMLTYELAYAENVYITIHDLTGRKLAIVENARLSAGTQTHLINAPEIGLSSGVYMIQIQAENNRALKRIILME